MFGVAHAYGLERVEPTVTFTLLSISYQPSLVDDPVTASRTVRRRGVDYNRLSAVFRLVDEITSEGITLEEAYRGLAEIRRNRHPYPSWALTVASGLLSGARLHAGRRRDAGLRRRGGRLDARRPAGLARVRRAGCRSSTSSWSRRCRPPRWASPSAWLHAQRAGVRGDHRWAVRADPGAGAGRRRPGRADRLLHHRRRPSAGGRLPHRRHRRRRAQRALHRSSAEPRPAAAQPGAGAGRLQRAAGADRGGHAAGAGVLRAAPAGTSHRGVCDPERRRRLGRVRRARPTSPG